MPRELFTAADIRRLAHAHKTDVLVLGPGDLITPEAVDLAKALGVRLVQPNGAALSAPAGAGPGHGPPARAGLAPLKAVPGAGVALEPFGVGLAAPGTQVQLKDVVTSTDGSPMAAGYMTLSAPPGQAGEFPWTLSYDEIDVVLEGELVITRGAEVVRGGPGDVIYIPRGSTITFGTPRHARFVYVAFPADWNAASTP
jgi:ethanolamine utilization protein EutQ